MWRMPVTADTSRNIRSVISFDAPYGLTGSAGVCSLTNSSLGAPYTAADEEKMNCSTPSAMQLSTNAQDALVLFR